MVKKYTFWLRSVIVLQVLTGLIHSLSFFGDRKASNETEGQLLDLMTNYKIDMGAGFMRSMDDIMNSLSISFMLLFFFGGFLNWFLLKKHLALEIMKGVIWINIIIFGACLAAMIFFAFLPPIVLNGLVFICLIGSLLTINNQINNKQVNHE
jgi:hypothetical protein